MSQRADVPFGILRAFLTRIAHLWTRWEARYDAVRRILERRIRLNRWFPHIPIGLVVALIGLMLIDRSAVALLGDSIRSVELKALSEQILAADLGALPDFVIGGLLLVTALGLVNRARFAWWLAVTALSLSLVYRLQLGSDETDVLVLYFRAILLIALLFNHGHFNARSALMQGAFGVYAVLIFLVCATALTLRRGAQFEPEILDPITALYFVVVTITSVGFGDITPLDSETRGFVLGLIVIGVFVLGASISVFLIPFLSNRLRLILGHQENPVNRSKHYVVIGTSALARNAAVELEKRGQSITFVIGKANADAFYDKRDVIVGDATDLGILRESGVEKSRGVLALSTDDPTNGFVVLGVNELDPTIPTVAALNDPANQSRLERTQPSILLTLPVLGGQLLAMALTGEHVDENLLENVLKIHGDLSGD